MGFKVIIAGGSVSGLSLANMLEKFNIDYVLLEAYPQIAPQVGASIGLLSNGFRILDQFGCYEPIRDIAGDFYLKASIRGSDGRVKSENSRTSTHHLENRLGYPSIFIDRQILLQVLYDNLQHKEKVLTKKRVSRVDLVKGGVQVHTDDGSVYEGDIIVGADGIHSAVREEMWRIGKEETPGYFPEDEQSRVPVDTKCIFGISKRPTDLPPYTQQTVHQGGRSYLIVHAPGNRTYWFLFKGTGKTIYGKDIPRYSEDDKEKLASEHKDDKVYDDLTFGAIYKNRIMSTLVPLEEYVFEKWHYKRIITIGDASHKIDPISGQGGNGAIEAAALLINALTDMLEKNPKNPTEEDISNAFAYVHEKRHARAKALVSSAHNLQMILTGRSPLSTIVVNVLMPILGEESFLKTITPIATASHHIKRLPLPKRLRLIPYNDELPARPIESKATWAPFVLSAGVLGALLYQAASPAYIANVVRSFQALPALLNGATSNSSLVASFAAPAAENTAQTIQLRANLLSALTMWFVEGSRVGNKIAVLSWPATAVAAYTILGPKAVMPAFSLATLLLGANNIPGRHVPTNIAKSILPAVVTGYGIPMVLASLPIQNPQLRQAANVVATAAPLLSAALLKLIPNAIKAVKNLINPPKPDVEVKEEDTEEFLDMYQKKDVAPLKSTYAFTAGVCAVAHIVGAIYTNFESPSTVGAAGLLTGSGALFGLASITLSSYLTWDLRTQGYLTNKQTLVAGLANLASNILLGPGAAFSGFFYWREHVISSLGDTFP
ncbi:FAD-dependent monooxygenase andE [Colletotrichum aenigma]|uniref:FAD-dependent monooxygenase andE n=1 Tax=Colletotrichum aenigma TaxID=1215731 RepID=UPI001872F667|nr:FAD-dependent monooxygenase andE [Colletotrichum aenigma]KAF5524540.1 FAD-dependent monooxygenase andE [Colletotrichum aenigma]